MFPKNKDILEMQDRIKQLEEKVARLNEILYSYNFPTVPVVESMIMSLLRKKVTLASISDIDELLKKVKELAKQLGYEWADKHTIGWTKMEVDAQPAQKEKKKTSKRRKVVRY